MSELPPEYKRLEDIVAILQGRSWTIVSHRDYIVAEKLATETGGVVTLTLPYAGLVLGDWKMNAWLRGYKNLTITLADVYYAEISTVENCVEAIESFFRNEYLRRQNASKRSAARDQAVENESED